MHMVKNEPGRSDKFRLIIVDLLPSQSNIRGYRKA